MPADGLRRDTQCPGYLTAAHPPRQQPQDVDLPFGEASRPLRSHPTIAVPGRGQHGVDLVGAEPAGCGLRVEQAAAAALEYAGR